MTSEVHARRREVSRQGGFTLIEALIAIIVLIFGLVAVAQLFAVAASSNGIANRGTVAAAVASQEIERLTTVPYSNLVPGGSLDADTAGFVREADVPSAGRIRTRWQVTATAAGGQNFMFIAVRSEALGPFGSLTRAEFTTFRALNSAGAI